MADPTSLPSFAVHFMARCPVVLEAHPAQANINRTDPLGMPVTFIRELATSIPRPRDHVAPEVESNVGVVQVLLSMAWAVAFAWWRLAHSEGNWVKEEEFLKMFESNPQDGVTMAAILLAADWT